MSAEFCLLALALAAPCDCVMLSVVFELASFVLAITSGSWNNTRVPLRDSECVDTLSDVSTDRGGGD